MATPTILVVDDEPTIVNLASLALRHHGYNVLSAVGAYAALQVIDNHSPVDLVLSDVMMPDMHGPELIKTIAGRSPSTAFVLMSGYAFGDPLPPGVPLLTKPISLPELVSTVQRELARSADPIP